MICTGEYRTHGFSDERNECVCVTSTCVGEGGVCVIITVIYKSFSLSLQTASGFVIKVRVLFFF